ncbi:MAG TPA: hypothetical protein VKV95_08110 [Terriglobia bacterium]|nr:hypothetical protein [Terriglobia bacterium]
MIENSGLTPQSKMIEDYKALNSRVDALQREAFKFGAILKTIGYALINEKQSVAVARGSHIVVSEVHDKVRPRIRISDLDPNRLVELLNDLEDATKQRERLFVSLREIGAPVH